VKRTAFWILPLICALCFGASAQSGGNRKPAHFTDQRNGQKYHTVKIGKKIWMAENLNYAAGNSMCYDNNPSNCVKYGRLYAWDDAMKACPTGWRLPNNDDWQNLVQTAGDEAVAGGKLKSKTGWSENGNGTDDFGFSALPGGYRNIDGKFYSAGYYGTWWSATEYDANVAYSRYALYYGNGVVWLDNYKSYLFSVRCVRE
jgi:uncharacterized protein (TIGR02145 family)